MQLSKNFELNEFASGPVSPGVQANLILLARQLQALRDYFGKPVKIITGISQSTPEHASGKAAIFFISGKSGNQIQSALEDLIKNGSVFPGTIGLLNADQVYYSLTPQNQRWDKRTSGNPGNGGTGQGGGNTNLPAQTQDTSASTNKKLLMAALVLGLIIAGTVMLKKDKKK
jgi:hypothetical protein